MPRKKEKTAKAKPKGIPFTERFHIDEERKIRLVKLSGLIVAAFAVFTLVSVVSYLFTWKADQSLLSDPAMMNPDVSVSNMGGKLGYRWGYFLVCNCFGLGSFAMIVLLFAASARLFFRSQSIGMLRTSVLTVSAAIVSSVILSYVSGMVSSDIVFGGGLGGDCGAVTSAWLNNLVGPVVTALILLICSIVWLLYASGRFSRWFLTAGDRPRGEEETAGNGKSYVGNVTGTDTVTPVDCTDASTMTHPGDDVTDAEDSVNEIPATTQRPAPEDGTDLEYTPTPAAGGVKDPDEDIIGNDKEEMEVIHGEGFSTDVTKDLPRIDTREELCNFKFPPLDLLEDYASGRHEVSQEELERNNNKIRATLRNYKIEIEKVTACTGPTVTLYKITPAPGVKISAIRSREEDIAMALGAKGVRVVNLPDAVGIEVANDRPSIVPLKSMLNDDSFRNSKYELPVAIGYTITQKVKTFDLTDAPHLLVAGATKQGKSVGLNVIISSLIYAKHPSELKMVFIDPKMVEFNAYSKLLKHYLAVLPNAASEQDEKDRAIIKQPKQAEEILRSLCLEMDERYELISKSGTNNIVLYNNKYKDRHLLPTEGHRFLPYIVVVIDEYADLVMSSGMGGDSKNMARSISASIIRLAQKGRAAGIHVIIATQRPSVDVITGIIKANFPMRIAFRTLSRIDSNTILDSSGAEKLIGRGDMLYYSGVDMERVQCALVGMDEICKITDFIGAETGYRQCYNTPYYLPEPKGDDSGDGGAGEMVDMKNLDSLFQEAAEMVVINQQGSTSYLQRKLGMGYARAGKVMDQLEAAGIVGPQEGSKPREVLVRDLEELKGILDAFL
ncbi:MAG: DNA translocase FtsK [Clostridium sp.]|nr:DNA translocase FtsK [Bacteroides sp.]MCM1197756.1 DNA translocase FtsK [Clostridium sp.]